MRTLGRGGSDTSAVALGSSLGAEVVEIYSDVDGIANCDPRQIPEAIFMDQSVSRRFFLCQMKAARLFIQGQLQLH
ncbi:MAG: hypothetical protein CM1200mP28_05220 [Deltaproteobacteria bacterium]|nr:MAG: hypothetical protein CM1200mP28_05220 [Deltaproteobacteria bacterium]